MNATRHGSLRMWKYSLFEKYSCARHGLGYLNMKKSIVGNLFVIVFALIVSLGTAECCNAQSKDKSTEALDLIVSVSNSLLPQDYYGNGMVNTKLVVEGDYLVYYYICDEPKYDIDRMSQNIPLMKDAIIAEVNSDDYLISELRRACKEAGVGIAYYYVGKNSGKIAKVLVPVQDLK